MAGLALADLGARVVKLEPVGGEPTRSSGQAITENCSTAFAVLNRNKKSVTLNLKSEEGRKFLCGLIPHFDVFIENNRPGVVNRLGADYETLSSVNPGLVMLSISAFGQNGPYGDRGGDDKVSQAIAGLMSLTGHDPADPGAHAGDRLYYRPIRSYQCSGSAQGKGNNRQGPVHRLGTCG